MEIFMKKEEIYERLCVLLDRLGLLDKKADNLKMDTKLEEYGMTSYTFIQFIVELENDFNLHIKDDELEPEQFDTLRKIIYFIEAKKNVGKSDGN